MALLRDRIKAFLNPTPVHKPAKVTSEQMNDVQLAMRSAVRARYDSTFSTPENARHWQFADRYNADTALTPEVRVTIRSQARYELNENNSYGRGMVDTVVNDTIGKGPRLQIAQFSQTVNEQIEQSWRHWATAIDLADDLTTVRTAKLVDGEAVIRFINHVNVEDPVQLDLQLIECDQLRSPRFVSEISSSYVDGVHLDRFGNPYSYDLLRHHPGARYWEAVDFFEYDTYSYDQIIHLFKRTRPGQHRGISEFAPALPLFAFLRRFTLATVSAAETAAAVSQVIETDAPIPEELEAEYAASTFEKFMDTIPVDRNSATVLPNMWKLKQFAAEHPTTTYAMFKREIVAEIGRCLCIPVNIGTADSGESNFSSAKFDWLGYERSIIKEQNYLSVNLMDRIFAEWLLEASLVGSIPKTAANFVIREYDRWGRRGMANRVQHSWYWDGLRDADAKEAADAQKIRLQNGSTHRSREYALQGLDIEVEDRKAAESFGVSVEEYRKWVMASIFTNGNLLQQEQEQQSTQQNQGDDDEPVEQDEEQASESTGTSATYF
jgi:lambda family phage portal protein